MEGRALSFDGYVIHPNHQLHRPTKDRTTKSLCGKTKVSRL